MTTTRTPGPYANTILALSEDQQFHVPSLHLTVTSITVLPPAAVTQHQSTFALAGHSTRPGHRFTSTDAIYTADNVPALLSYARPSVRALLSTELSLYSSGALPAPAHSLTGRLHTAPPLQNVSPNTPARKQAR